MSDINLFGHTITLSIRTFFDTIDRKFFTPDFETYEHMTFFNNPTAFKWLILGLYFGVILAAIVMFYNKHILGGFVRSLDRKGCLTPETALTLNELDYEKNIFIKASLMFGVTLRRVVSFVPNSGDNDTRVGGNLYNSTITREKTLLNTDKFYISESKRDPAIQRFSVKGNGILPLILTAVIGIAVVLLIIRFAPSIVGMFDKALDGFSGKSDTLN